MGAVLKVENGIHVFQCGGTLIDDRHVITVAHCVSRFAGYSQGSSYSIIVRLGEWDTQQESELIPHEDYRVISVMTHPEFMNQSLWNDMAILKLDRSVEFKENINPVCLPSPLDQFEGQLCTTTGWGKNAYRECRINHTNKVLQYFSSCYRGWCVFKHHERSTSSSHSQERMLEITSIHEAGSSFQVTFQLYLCWR